MGMLSSTGGVRRPSLCSSVFGAVRCLVRKGAMDNEKWSLMVTEVSHSSDRDLPQGIKFQKAEWHARFVVL
jgi:hypothetical protein